VIVPFRGNSGAGNGQKGNHMKKDLEKKIEEISKSCLGDESLAEVEMEVEKSIVGDCPICKSGFAVIDCGDMPGIDDSTMGHCANCKIYWCLTCGVILGKEQKSCDHWKICEGCAMEEECAPDSLDALDACEKIKKWKECLPDERKPRGQDD
jgi:hypothetical protein